MKAWIENNIIRDIAHSEPFEIYHPEVAVFYDTEVPDDAENGDSWIKGKLVKKVIPESVVVPVEPTISLDVIRNNLSFAEKVKWDNDKTDEIVTAKIEFAQPLSIAAATEVLQFLVDSKAISKESMDKILL